jgi:hypothetical protein
MEVVAHIADFEPILTDRLMRVAALDRPLLLVADENLFTEKLSPHERELEEELTFIAAIRKRTARILKSLPVEFATHKTGVHSFKGLMTLEAVLTAAAKHVPHHLPFIVEKRKALGV